MTTKVPEDLLVQARTAIDQDQVYQFLLNATGQEPDSRTVEALQEAAAEELVVTALGATNRARRRARPPEAEDIAEIVEERGDCDCDSGSAPTRPLFAYWESD